MLLVLLLLFMNLKLVDEPSVRQTIPFPFPFPVALELFMEGGDGLIKWRSSELLLLLLILVSAFDEAVVE